MACGGGPAVRCPLPATPYSGFVSPSPARRAPCNMSPAGPATAAESWTRLQFNRQLRSTDDQPGPTDGPGASWTGAGVDWWPW